MIQSTPAPFLFGLSLTETITIAIALAALWISWRTHVHTKSKDNVKFSAVVRFDSWRKPIKYNVGEGSVTHADTKCFHIILYNQGPEFRIHYCHIHSRPLCRWPKQFFYKIHGVNEGEEIVEKSNGYAIRGELEATDKFERLAKLEVHTRSNESFFVKMEGWKKAKAEFEGWKKEEAKSKAELEANVEAKLEALD